MRCPRQTRRQDLAHEQGFTLIEALIAMVILVGGLTALAVAKQKATQALEGVYSARNDASVGFASIQNKSTGGIFNDGFQPLFLPGANGIVGTTSDTGTLDSETLPGPDGIMGTADDVTMPLVNLQRQILIQPVTNPDGSVSADLRQITVTIRVNSSRRIRDYTVTGYISRYQ
jgi:prepilin-type N-terminal cleavage/methylation domain-containing protein